MPSKWGGGRRFDASTGFFFTKTAVIWEQKVNKSLPGWEMKGLSEGYKRPKHASGIDIEISFCLPKGWENKQSIMIVQILPLPMQNCRKYF